MRGLDESAARAVHDRLEINIKKLTELKDQLEDAHPYLRKQEKDKE